MKRNLLAVALFLLSSTAFAELNYDPKYLWAEYEKCNAKPLKDIMYACDAERKKGLQHQGLQEL